MINDTLIRLWQIAEWRRVCSSPDRTNRLCACVGPLQNRRSFGLFAGKQRPWNTPPNLSTQRRNSSSSVAGMHLPFRLKLKWRVDKKQEIGMKLIPNYKTQTLHYQMWVNVGGQLTRGNVFSGWHGGYGCFTGEFQAWAGLQGLLYILRKGYTSILCQGGMSRYCTQVYTSLRRCGENVAALLRGPTLEMIMGHSGELSPVTHIQTMDVHCYTRLRYC